MACGKHPELKTIDGILANPDKVGGRFHNCPVGWGCRIVNDNLKVVQKLEANGVEVFDHGSGAISVRQSLLPLLIMSLGSVTTGARQRFSVNTR